MTRYLLDTNAVTALANRREPFASRVREARLRGAVIGTCEPVVGELYYGLELSATRDVNQPRVERALSELRTWPFDRRAAREYGRVAAELRRRARTMQIIDMMVAAVAFTLRNCVVISTDSDLLAVPGLTVENWATAPSAND
ncbi:MAG: type II toxin-antitoxin system VapC family toxin [Phycisphaerae bacterium]|nr:type II toxin-antitoxin system VapC family toxin [Tepidisphaeraceae bacterium]